MVSETRYHAIQRQSIVSLVMFYNNCKFAVSRSVNTRRHADYKIRFTIVAEHIVKVTYNKTKTAIKQLQTVATVSRYPAVPEQNAMITGLSRFAHYNWVVTTRPL